MLLSLHFRHPSRRLLLRGPLHPEAKLEPERGVLGPGEGRLRDDVGVGGARQESGRGQLLDGRREGGDVKCVSCSVGWITQKLES